MAFSPVLRSRSSLWSSSCRVLFSVRFSLVLVLFPAFFSCFGKALRSTRDKFIQEIDVDDGVGEDDEAVYTAVSSCGEYLMREVFRKRYALLLACVFEFMPETVFEDTVGQVSPTL